MSDVRFYHGGAPGLRPGDLLLPVAKTGSTGHLVDGCPTCEARKRGEQIEADPCRSDRVYFTTDRRRARIYAAGYPRGAVYLVAPEGPVEIDPDDDASFACAALRVRNVYDPLVILEPKEIRRLARDLERQRPRTIKVRV